MQQKITFNYSGSNIKEEYEDLESLMFKNKKAIKRAEKIKKIKQRRDNGNN